MNYFQWQKTQKWIKLFSAVDNVVVGVVFCASEIIKYVKQTIKTTVSSFLYAIGHV